MRKFYLQGDKWQQLQYCNINQYKHIFAVAGEITRMQVSILRQLYDIAISYLWDIQKMLEMTILHTQTDWLTRWKI